jgi:hypothetical protein
MLDYQPIIVGQADELIWKPLPITSSYPVGLEASVVFWYFQSQMQERHDQLAPYDCNERNTSTAALVFGVRKELLWKYLLSRNHGAA